MLNQTHESQHVTLIWLVALGLTNSVVSAFYYVRVLKAMFLREAGTKRMVPPDRGIALPIVVGTIVVAVLGLMPESLIGVMQAAAVPMLTSPIRALHSEEHTSAIERASQNRTEAAFQSVPYSDEQQKAMTANQGLVTPRPRKSERALTIKKQRRSRKQATLAQSELD